MLATAVVVVIAVLAAAPGTPSAAEERPAGDPAAPVSAMVPAAGAAAEPAPQEPQRRYDEEYIQLEDYAWVSGSHGETSTAIRTVPYQGKYRKPLESAEFYRAVGRPDLEAAYLERQGTRTALMAAGLAGMLGGALYTMASFHQAAPDPTAGPEVFRQQAEAAARAQNEAMWIGLGISLGGLVLAAIGLSMNPHPVTAPEARRLADEHNQQLRQELGLPREPPVGEAPPGAPSPVARRLSLGLLPEVGGASARLRVAF
jgi:pyruvate/2-oxoglutarate dehydrogenase complex dihydrolipoamide acyltransferase (E2) component